MIDIKTFLKFGSEENINDLYRNGTIYMKPIQWFRKHHDEFNNLRGDRYEGVSKVINGLPGEFEIPYIHYKGSHLGIHAYQSYEVLLGNLFCLFCISSNGWKNPNDFNIDKKMRGFGTHCLMVKDNARFLELIKEKLKELDVKYHIGFVDYYDEKKVNGTINLFAKRQVYAYQKEFRIYVERDEADDFKFQIGSLEGIAEAYRSDEIIKGLSLEYSKQN